MISRADLLQRACRHQKDAFGAADVSTYLNALPDWSLQGGKLVRTFAFRDYHKTIAFVNLVVPLIHREDHHPDLLVGYNRCTVSYSTHSVNGGQGGLSENDFICAAKIDDVFQRSGL